MGLFEVSHLSVSYIREGKTINPVEDVSFSLEAGHIYDVAGASGEGKSTLLAACARMIARKSGSLALAGKDSACFSPQRWRRHVCLVPQQVVMFPGTVRDNLLYPWSLSVNAGTEPPSDEILNALLGLVLLEGVALNTDAGRLSGGQRSRVALLRAFATRPRVLLLDEVESALDEEAACAVSRLTRAMVDDRTSCLRIRHREDDGCASGTFILKGGHLDYRRNAEFDRGSFASGDRMHSGYSAYDVVSQLAAVDADSGC